MPQPLAAETALCAASHAMASRQQAGSFVQAGSRCRAGDITHLHWYCTVCTVLSLALAQRVLISTCDAGDVAAPRHRSSAQVHDAASTANKACHFTPSLLPPTSTVHRVTER